MTPDAIAAQLEYLAKRLRCGCGNAGCQVHEPVGLHTNGACNCQPTNYAKQLMGLVIECEQQGHFWAKDE